MKNKEQKGNLRAYLFGYFETSLGLISLLKRRKFLSAVSEQTPHDEERIGLQLVL